MSSTVKLGWFGLGSMGIGMALNLQNHLTANGLPRLHYSNRSLSRGEPLKAAGAAEEETFENVLSAVDIIFTMISNDAVLESLLEKALASGVSLKGKIWVDTSTVHPDTSTACAARLAEKGATFVASPVFGASPVAAAGKLIFAMAGPPETVDRLRPFILDVMAKNIIYLGEDARKASLLKITGNIFVVGVQELIAEMLVFAEKTGFDTKQLEEFVGNMFGPVIESYSKRMTSGAYAPPLDTQPGFVAALAAKDAGHAVSMAKSHGTVLPTIELALSRINAAREYAAKPGQIWGKARLLFKAPPEALVLYREPGTEVRRSEFRPITTSHRRLEPPRRVWPDFAINIARLRPWSIMKIRNACQQCRESKRKCARESVDEPCNPCRKRNLHCASLHRPRAQSSVSLLPKPVGAANAAQDPSGFPLDAEIPDLLSKEVATDLVEHYLQKLHDRPHSLFHPPQLREEVRRGSVNRALLLAICSMGSRFSDDAAVRSLEDPLMAESKRLLLADLENINLENIQTCILIANLCVAHLNPSSEALFFRIANSMAQIMGLSTLAPSSPVIDCEVRRRVWWTLFMADRWSSSGLGLPRQIKDFGLTLDLPMDEGLFNSLSPETTSLDCPWKPGLWAHMVSLVQLFGPIQDLNRRSAQGDIEADELDRTVGILSQQLENWEWMLPVDAKMSSANLELHRAQGTGGTFVALHLGYYHYATLLYFRFLDQQASAAPAMHTYLSRCKQHASSYSHLLRMARQQPGCEVIYPTVGHMAAVSSSVLLHTLLFGDEQELQAARDELNSNFEAIVELGQYWPNTAPIEIQRLVTFQNFCLLSTDYKTHQLDGWMIRFLIEYSLPLGDKEVQTVKSGMDLEPDIFSARTQQLTEEGRYTTFTVPSPQDWYT